MKKPQTSGRNCSPDRELPLKMLLAANMKSWKAKRFFITMRKKIGGRGQGCAGHAGRELGGPDSEMFWDFGAGLKLHENSQWANEPCHVNCDCGRFLEIGNNVFMEYVKRAGKIEKMATHNVDFGGGLERMAAATINDPDAFKIDLFWPIIEKIEQLSKKKYGKDRKTTTAMRVIADHARSVTFLIGDGVVPSNKDRGYFCRRLIRRAVVKAQELGIGDNFLAGIAGKISDIYGGVCPLPVQTINRSWKRKKQNSG